MTRNSKKSNWLVVALSLLMLVFSFSALAQRVDGNIGGRTTAGDTVAINNPETGFKRDTVADEDGEYRFRSVPLGTYVVAISRGGEPVLKVQVLVRPGGTTRIPTPGTPAADAANARSSAIPAN